MGFLIRTLVTAVALWIAVLLVSGIEVTATNTWRGILTLLAVAVIFGVVNAVLKPLIKLVGCIFYIITLGLIALVVNALLFMLVGWLAEQLNLPFRVDGFWSAFWGAIIVGVVSWMINLAIPDRKPRYPATDQGDVGG
jgi:putative membrane protein